jgi:hypothetical protein
MGIDSTFRRLGRFLDEWDRGETTVHSVTVTDCADAGTDEGVAAEVEVSVPIATPGDGSGRAVCTPEIGPDGTLTLNLETDVPIVAASDEAVDIEPVDASFGSDGRVTVTCSGTVAARDTETRAESRGSGLGTESTDGGVSDDRPPFKNPELLQEVYDAHDTFAEMAEALDMDVTGETVRRYMIDYNIHQPNSYSSNDATAADSDGGEAVVLSDGIGLPDNVSVEALIETVNRSNTIHEVKEDLDMERKEAHEMLKELNLVSVVMGRLANDAGRQMQREDIVEHLREVSQQR